MYQKLYNNKAYSRDMESRRKMQIHSEVTKTEFNFDFFLNILITQKSKMFQVRLSFILGNSQCVCLFVLKFKNIYHTELNITSSLICKH